MLTLPPPVRNERDFNLMPARTDRPTFFSPSRQKNDKTNTKSKKKSKKEKEKRKSNQTRILWLKTKQTADDCDERPLVKRSLSFVLIAPHS
jgi:hypothetical protein